LRFDIQGVVSNEGFHLRKILGGEGEEERPESTRVPKVFLRIARKSILFEQKK
jgi:hypothetical protein